MEGKPNRKKENIEKSKKMNLENISQINQERNKLIDSNT